MPSVQESIGTFLKVGRSPHTLRFYSIVLTEMSEMVGMKRDIKRVRYEDLLDYTEVLRKRLKQNSVRTYVSVVQAFFNWCVKRAYIRQSPAEDLRIRVERSGDNRAIPPDELQKMVEYARVTSRRDYALLLFLVDTGCRVGGLSRLTIGDVNLDQRTAILHEKGNKLHRVYFTETTADALSVWLRQRPEVDHDGIWTGKAPYHQMKSNAISGLVRRLAGYAGASRKWGPHSIRHAVGHAMAKEGLPASAVQAKLGHESAVTTINFYFPHDENYMRQLADQYPLIALKGQKEVVTMPRLVPRKEAK